VSSALVAIKSANLPKSAERPRPLGQGRIALTAKPLHVL
jgi:hypothetical protein